MGQSYLGFFSDRSLVGLLEMLIYFSNSIAGSDRPQRQRQDIFESFTLAFQAIGLALRETSRWKIRRRAATRTGLCRVTDQGFQGTEPTLGQIPNRVGGQNCVRPGPGGGQFQAIGPLEGNRFDLQNLDKGQVGIVTALGQQVLKIRLDSQVVCFFCPKRPR